METLLTTQEVATLMHCNVRTVGIWRRLGMIRSIRASYGYLFRQEWVDEFLDTYAGLEVSSLEKCQYAMAVVKHRNLKA